MKPKCNYLKFINYTICFLYAYMIEHLKFYIIYTLKNKKFSNKKGKEFFNSCTYRNKMKSQMEFCDFRFSFMILLCMILPFSLIIAKCLSLYFNNGLYILLIVQTLFSVCVLFLTDENVSEYFSIFYRINILRKKRFSIYSLFILDILAWMTCIYIFL